MRAIVTRAHAKSPPLGSPSVYKAPRDICVRTPQTYLDLSPYAKRHVPSKKVLSQDSCGAGEPEDFGKYLDEAAQESMDHFLPQASAKFDLPTRSSSSKLDCEGTIYSKSGIYIALLIYIFIYIYKSI